MTTGKTAMPPSPLHDVEEWLRWRQDGIGSSDSPAILGVCPRRTRMAVYLDKIGEGRRRSESNEACTWGKRLEPLIAAAYTERTGIIVERREVPVWHPKHPQLRATLDGVCEDGRFLEMKSVGRWGDFDAKEGDYRALPESWLVQLQHQLLVTGQEWADLAVFVPLELRIFSVPRIPSLCNLILDSALELWSCVEDRVPPATNDPRDADLISRCYPRAEGEIVLADPAFLAHADAIAINRTDKAAKVALQDAMGEAMSATLADGRIVRRKVTVRAAYTVASATITTFEIEHPKASGVNQIP